MDNFCRKLRLKEFFHDRTMDNDSIVKNKSYWEPKSGTNTTLDTTINYLKLTKEHKSLKINTRTNISHNERNAIASLKNNDSLIIKEADKGAAVVLMNTDFYKSKCYEILNDPNTYQKITDNRDKNTITKIKTMLKKYEHYLTKDEMKYLTNFEYKTSLFYGLPKIHKSKIIIAAIEEQNSEYVSINDPLDLKLRPIVAGTTCPTHRISHFLDLLLQPLLKFVPAYLKNNVDFLNKLPHKLKDSEIFVTLDVVSLYSNISHDLGYKAIKYWLNEYYDHSNRIPAKLILEGCKLILENNCFEFNNEYFVQTSGTAMGTKFAPSYATLVLGYLEQNLYNQIYQTFGKTTAEKIKNNYKRYLDDVFLIWDKQDGEVSTITNLMNDLDSKLSFTCDNEGDSVTFLDIKLIKSNNEIITDIYYKPTDTKQYLEYNSSHPRHTKNNIPFSLARRICTIVSNTELRDQRLKELSTFLQERKYPITIINHGISLAKQIPVQELRSSKNTEQGSNEIIAYISTFNPNFEDNFGVIKSTFNNLQCHTETKEIFKDAKLIKSKRQPSNLKNLLTRAKLTNKKEQGVSKCGKSRCKLCTELIEGDTFKFEHTNEIFNIKSKMNCATLNCIYVIKCQGCTSTYIGETCNFRSRTNLHRDHIKNNTGLYVNKHINKCAKKQYPQFNIMPIYKVKKDDEKLRKTKERNFINKYKPELNK